MNGNKKVDDYIYCTVLNGRINIFTANEYSSIINLRKFHNWIKEQLIMTAKKLSNNGNSLLDIAVGRGGDLYKWNKAGIETVLGFDYDNRSIFGTTERDGFDGAERRYKNAISKNAPPQVRLRNRMYARFYNLSALSPNIVNLVNQIDKNKLYDIVSCQFAFHYFAKTDESLNHVFNLVSSKLKNGGIFIATMTDGDLINKNIKNGNIDFPSLKINKKSDNSYQFYLQPDKTDKSGFFQITTINEEYMVFKKKLVEIANIHNLQVVQMENFYHWYKKYTGTNLTVYEMLVSFLNFSIIFKKV